MRVFSTVLVALLLAACTSPASEPAPTPSEVAHFALCDGLTGGKSGLPEVTVPCFTGGAPVVASQLRGPVVINFWASWCQPCIKELPAFQRLHDSRRVGVVGVATDDRREAALALAVEVGAKFPMLFDAKGELRRARGESALPLTLFVTAAGDVTSYSGPALTDETLGTLVSQRLGGAA